MDLMFITQFNDNGDFGEGSGKKVYQQCNYICLHSLHMF